MNYFINTYKPILVISAIPLAAIFTLAGARITLFLVERRLKLSEQSKKILIIAGAFGTFFLFFFLFIVIHNHYNVGAIKRIYVFQAGDQTRLVVWSTREDLAGAGQITFYSQRLKSYDLATGKLMSSAYLSRKYYMDDYKMYGLFNGKAWGYGRKSGVSLVDLFNTRTILDEKEILKRDPRLGKAIRIFSGTRPFDPRTNELLVTALDGRTYWISPALDESPARKVTYLYQYHPKIRADLHRLLDKKKESVLSALSLGKEIYIFVTRRDLTLSAVRINRESKKILGRIDYFK